MTMNQVKEKKVAKKKVQKKKKAEKKVKKTKKVIVEVKYVWGELNKQGEKVYKLHGGQSKILRSKKRFTAAIAGTGGGKTVLGPLWIARRIKQLISEGVTSGMIGMVIAPTYKILSRATVPTLIETFRDTDLEGRYLEAKGQYILPSGMGVLYLLSSDIPEGLEGGQLNIGAWLDEGGQMSYKAWMAIMRRTGVNQAPILITTTPYLANWLKTDFLERFIQGDPDYAVTSWSSIKNPNYPKAEFERARRVLSEAAFNMMYCGDFVSLEGLVFTSFANCVCEPKEILGGRLVGGIDFGWRAPFCALGGTLYMEDGKDVLYIGYERYKTRCHIEEHAADMPNSHIWYADPSEPDQIDSLRRLGHRVVPANNSILVGIRAANERINDARLQVSSECTNLIIEAGMYQYPDVDDEEKPIDGMDHTMDAFRYLCMGLYRKKPKEEKGKIMMKRYEHG